jgi:hypothetical protein
MIENWIFEIIVHPKPLKGLQKEDSLQVATKSPLGDLGVVKQE